MGKAFAEKLSITAAVLGCATRKELCARFRAVNPATEFDLERSYKWIQGRALPRSQQIYEDWARVVRTERSGPWLAGCSSDAFLDEVCALFSADRAQIMQGAAAFGGVGLSSNKEPATEDPVCGLYVAYSWAWSPYKRGQLIRGLFRLSPGKRGRLEVVYTEALPSGPLECRGTAMRDGPVLHAEAEDLRSKGRDRLFFSLLAPGRPSNVLCGRLQGVIVVGPEPQPSTTRIAMVRVGERQFQPQVERVCYLPASPAQVCDDLGLLGRAGRWAEDLSDEILRFLSAHATGGSDRVSMTDVGAMAALLDRMEVREEARYLG